MRRVWYIILLLAMLGSCRKAGTEQREMVAKLTGQEIEFPEELTYQIQDTPIDFDPHYGEWKIVAYIDSTGCTPCRMKLPKWNEIINEFKSDIDTEVGFLMILNSAEGDNDVDFSLRRDNFQHPVSYDPDGSFGRSNSLTDEDSYHYFLLDHENRIVAVGNPAANPKVREVYRKAIFGDAGTPGKGMCAEPTVALGAIAPGDSIRKRFALTNNSDMTLTVQEIMSSCDCTTAIIEPDTLQPGVAGIVTVSYVADSVSGPVARYVEVYFNEKNDPERLTLHGFVTNNNH